MTQYNPHSNAFGSPAPKSGMSVLKIILIIGSIFGLLFVAAIAGLVYFVMQLAVDSDTLETTVADDQVTSLELPSNWTDLRGADRNVDASLQYGNLFAETYAMILTESKSDFLQMFGADAQFGIDDYSELIVEGMADANFKLGAADPVTVNGLSGRRIRMTTELEGIPIVYLVTLIDGNNHFHQVHCWTMQSRETKNMPTLKKIADSFRER
ncbi:hypothetical protein [Mariniblastus fucicola]|uniref:Uncharacterized protein n=1 Tax=Mariniblastus fucicola TaxID=980251 RepID=A0A5B9PA64_9BACT|nr:hypothetical protein [Mariniblastus fucicola]QEG21852.1 hypothetical protein MFFC18_17130 [Mariniblastus fucicola]